MRSGSTRYGLTFFDNQVRLYSILKRTTDKPSVYSIDVAIEKLLFYHQQAEMVLFFSLITKSMYL